MLKRRFLFVMVLSLIIGAVACTNTTEENNEASDSIQANVDTSAQKKEYQFFNLPSPIELYTFLYENNIKFQSQLMNPIDNVDKYITTEEKGIALGVYASDIAYCAVYNKSDETMNYFVTAKKIADDLGLTEGFDEKIADRINNNLHNSDSLYDISTDSYSMALNYLRSQNQEQLLPLMIFGGWIESVYITVNSYNEKTFNAESPIVFQTLDQGTLLENLLDYFKTLDKNNETINKIFKQLNDLQDIYLSIQDNVDVDITKEQFDNIKEQIIKIRNYWTKN
jgi:hypothetical protein